MSITTAELQRDLEKYLVRAESERVYITRDDRTIAVLSSPNADRLETAQSLFGALPADMTLEEARRERLALL
jgi:hypothetical protein